MAASKRKGRARAGGGNGKAINANQSRFAASLDPSQVKAVRMAYRKDPGKTRARAVTYTTLARQFKVSVATIRNVVKYKGTYGGTA